MARPHRLFVACLLALCSLSALLAPLAAAQPPAPANAVASVAPAPASFASPASPAAPAGAQAFMLELRALPAAVAATRAELLGQDSAQVTAAGQTQLAAVERDQQQTLASLAAVPELKLLFRVQNAFNGIALLAGPDEVAQLAALPGVRAVHPIPTHERANSSSVPTVGAPTVWGGVPGLTGAGVTIGIIDTGIDYLHTMFGGPGSYTGSDPTRIDDAPSLAAFGTGNKVAGGYDFVGEAYNGTGVGVPDPDPLDCPSTLGGGHGTHVAGTAAGFGVNADGSTYTGPYNAALDLHSMRIGPGVAPEATLYALRVFGCTGGTAYTAAAIDWAMDPNDDGNFSDRLDVINLSLGSPFGTASDPSAAALNNAVAAGVIAVASAGNSGDVYYIGGSPASAPAALSVANAVDGADTVDAFEVNNGAIAGVKPASLSANFPWAASSPVTATLVYPATNTTGCASFTGADAALLNGKIVLLDWAPRGSSRFPCDSGSRVSNAADAGAVGVILASGQNFFDTVIAGTETTPAVFTTFGIGTELKTALTQGAESTLSVTLSEAFRGSVRFVQPAAADTLNSGSSRGPQGISSRLKPDIAAPGTGIFSASSGTGTGGKNLSGTSMAAPHVAGAMALLRQQRPAWSVAELKALAMNTAGNDLFFGLGQSPPRYGPARAGSGRLDLPDAVMSDVIAFDSARPAEVSVSFGALSVQGSLSLTRTVALRNFGTTARTFSVGYDARTDIPGVAFSFPDGAQVTVPAGGSASFRVLLSASASAMRHVRDSTVAEQQGGYGRHWLSEASGLITLTPTAGVPLRVPIYATARPAASLRSAEPFLAFAGPTATTTITLAGSGLNDWRTAALPAEQVAVISPLELQFSGERLTTAGLENADLRFVGVHSDAAARAATGQPLADTRLWFGLATYGNWSAPASEVQFTVAIDRNRDGIADTSVIATRIATGGTSTDVFVSAVGNTLSSYLNGAPASALDTALFNSNVLLIPVTASQLGLGMGGATARFNYRVESARRFVGTVETTPWLSYDARNPGLDFSGGTPNSGSWLANSGDTLPVGFNQANFLANSSLGALLLHHFNSGEARAETLEVGLRQTLSFAALAERQYGDAPFTVEASSSAGLPVSLRASTPEVCSVSGTTVTILGAGSCTLQATQGGGAGFAPATASASFGVAQAPLLIAANDATRVAGRPNPAFSARYSGFVNGDDAADLDILPQVSSAAGRLSRPGSYPIEVSGAADANYAISYQNGILTITGGLNFLPLLR